MEPKIDELLRAIPSVSRILEHEVVAEWQHGLSRSSVVAAVQKAVDGVRNAILAGERTAPVEMEEILARAEEELLARSVPSLRPVINATGIVLHTGLGRAPLCEAAIEAIVEGAGGYCNLELDLETGGRSRRNAHVVERLISLTGAEAATVLNNNAAATYMIARTFASEAEIVVSRGELVEIGGGFRLPEIIAASGASLCEVGTTNRTRLSDYERAIGEKTSILMRVHTSNYRIVGFVESVGIGLIAELAHSRRLIAVDDLGSGALIDFESIGLPKEPCVRDSISAGADLVCFSGDKLLGGPQCGIIVGRRKLIDELDASPLHRTYRVGKLTLLALEATLRLYEEPEALAETSPSLRSIGLSEQVLVHRANALLDQLQSALPDEKFFVCSDVGYVGGGSMPVHDLETVVVQWRPGQIAVDVAVRRLRQGDDPAIARIRDDAVCFDLRTITESEFEALVDAVRSVTLEE